GIAARAESRFRQKRNPLCVAFGFAPDRPGLVFGLRHAVRVRAAPLKGKTYQRPSGVAFPASSLRRRAAAGATSGGGADGGTQHTALTSQLGRKSIAPPSI